MIFWLKNSSCTENVIIQIKKLQKNLDFSISFVDQKVIITWWKESFENLYSDFFNLEDSKDIELPVWILNILSYCEFESFSYEDEKDFANIHFFCGCPRYFYLSDMQDLWFVIYKIDWEVFEESIISGNWKNIENIIIKKVWNYDSIDTKSFEISVYWTNFDWKIGFWESLNFLTYKGFLDWRIDMKN